MDLIWIIVIAVVLLLVALTPAICEELAFRGEFDTMEMPSITRS